MQRESSSSKFPLGLALPTFKLPNVDGRTIGDEYLRGAKAALVVFTCNHCPYVKGSEQSLVSIVRRFEPAGLRVVAISANDATQYPEDSFEKMKEKSQSMKLPWPYLYDEQQNVAKLFDAACTPECYLFNAKGLLVYHGTINNSPKDPAAATVDYLSPAISQCLESGRCSPDYVHPIGCSIKWKV
ncbi:MAG: thioredoxin family protein [Bdellovibrionota bacterium]|nr:MAG: thioredoxin family protein [Bdellovibrionota bacterium]